MPERYLQCLLSRCLAWQTSGPMLRELPDVFSGFFHLFIVVFAAHSSFLFARKLNLLIHCP